MESWKKILIVYFVLVGVKVVLSLFVVAPSVFSDEYVFSKLARSVFVDQEFTVHSIAPNQQFPLYPIMLSLTYLAADMEVIYFLMKVVNAFLLTSIIFPAFWVAKDFVSEKKAFLAALLVSFLPSVFVTSFYVMSENLFYPLVMWFVYFLYKTKRENKPKYFLGACIALVAAIWTKFAGVLLIPLPLINLLVGVKKERRLKVWGLSAVVLLVTMVLFFFFVRGSFYLTALPKFVNNVSVLILPFVSWIVLYNGYVFLASGLLFGLYFLVGLKVKEKNFRFLWLITLLAFVLFVVAAANQSSSFRIFFESSFSWFTRRPIGRYVEAVLPLVVLTGFISFEKVKARIPMWIGIGASGLLGYGTLLTIAPLFPFNNSSLTLFGALKYVLDFFFVGSFVDTRIVLPSFMILGIILVSLPWLFLKKKEWQPYLVLAFFMMSSLLGFVVTVENSQKWYDAKQMVFGLEVKDLEGSKVVIDERDCVEKLYRESEGLCELTKKSTLLGFWMNKDIIIGDVYREDADLIISRHRLNLEVVKDLNGEVLVYRP